jgi:hypothetical protein
VLKEEEDSLFELSYGSQEITKNLTLSCGCWEIKVGPSQGKLEEKTRLWT